MKINKKEIFEWVRIVFIALAIAFILNNYVIVSAEVPSSSMENTVMTHDRIIAFRLSYLCEEPQRGDPIVFKYPDDEKQCYFKRIIGLPGEKVEIIDGKVYINDSDEPLVEDYLKENPVGSYGPYYVPEDSYFMMGDNRNISEDSRYWENTYLKEDKILGKVILTFFPTIKIVE